MKRSTKAETGKSPSNKTVKGAEPMDTSIREERVGTPATNHPRVCYAAKTLVAEVHELFPETPVEYSNVDGRNTALDVTFDTTVLKPDDQTLCDLLVIISDPRIEWVHMQEGQVLVSFRSNARTQDSREPFGLTDAYAVLTAEPDDEQTKDWPDDEVAMSQIGGSL